MTEPLRPVRVRSIQWEATDVYSFRLAALDGGALPPFTPGSHIDVHLPNGLMRSYSLSNAGTDGAYRITVARDANSSGGSAFLAEQLRPGATLEISTPRNHFELFEDAPLSIFIAGGIGITPFLPMAARLTALGRRWRLHHCVRTRDRAALGSEFEALAARHGLGEVVKHFDHEPGGNALDLGAVIAALAPDDHVYCCGPGRMLDAFRSTCKEQQIDERRVHFEYFKSNVESATDGDYEVVLARSGKTLRVTKGETLLAALLAAGIDVPFSCEEGVCGSCETRVLAGQPDHRDLILSDEERKASKTMMVCCSGCTSSSLTLDL